MVAPFILINHVSTGMQQSFTAKQNKRGPFLQNIPHKGASLQNSIVLQDLCCTVCKPQLFSMDNNATVLLYFMLMMHMNPFAMPVKPVFFYGLIPSNISSRFFSLCVYHVSL